MHKYVFLIIGTVWTQTILDKLVLNIGKLTKEMLSMNLNFLAIMGV